MGGASLTSLKGLAFLSCPPDKGGWGVRILGFHNPLFLQRLNLAGEFRYLLIPFSVFLAAPCDYDLRNSHGSND